MSHTGAGNRYRDGKNRKETAPGNESYCQECCRLLVVSRGLARQQLDLILNLHVCFILLNVSVAYKSIKSVILDALASTFAAKAVSCDDVMRVEAFDKVLDLRSREAHFIVCSHIKHFVGAWSLKNFQATHARDTAL